MKLRCLVFCVLLPFLVFSQRFDAVNSQNMFLADINGNPLMLRSYTDVEGSPYYNDNYCRANLKVMRGKSYTGIEVKLNLEDNRIIYKTPDGKEMETIIPVEFIEFSGCGPNGSTETFRSGFPPVDNQNQLSFYQVLDSGNVLLLKYRKISFMDSKSYGSANTTRKYDVTVRYYAYSAQKGMIPLSKGNENALSAFADKKKEMDSYIVSRKLKLKNEEDLVKLFAFYNNSTPKEGL